MLNVIKVVSMMQEVCISDFACNGFTNVIQLDYSKDTFPLVRLFFPRKVESQRITQLLGIYSYVDMLGSNRLWKRL
jgi:hypothetical protein